MEAERVTLPPIAHLLRKLALNEGECLSLLCRLCGSNPTNNILCLLEETAHLPTATERRSLNERDMKAPAPTRICDFPLDKQKCQPRQSMTGPQQLAPQQQQQQRQQLCWQCAACLDNASPIYHTLPCTEGAIVEPCGCIRFPTQYPAPPPLPTSTTTATTNSGGFSSRHRRAMSATFAHPYQEQQALLHNHHHRQQEQQQEYHYQQQLQLKLQRQKTMLALHSGQTRRGRTRAHTTTGYPPAMIVSSTRSPPLPPPSPDYHHSSSTRQPQKHRYHCGQCRKTFTRPSSLRIHSHTHTGEKPHICQFPGCNRRFSVQSNMRRHMRVHYYAQSDSFSESGADDDATAASAATLS